MKQDKTVVSVFGGSHAKPGKPEYEIAYELGKRLAEAGLVVCNGGYGGTMEASARGAREAHGKTIGILCRSFGFAPNPYIDTTILTDSLHDRLSNLVEMGNAYVILRGGTGTLLELATVWEYMNKHIIEQKPIVVIGSFWSPLVTTLRRELLEEGRNLASAYVREVDSPRECIEALLQSV